MRIDGEKPQLLLRALMTAAFSISTVACDVSDPRTPTVIPAISSPSRVPEVCSGSPELFRPPTLNRDSVAVYPSTVIVNRAGLAIGDLRVNPALLARINTDPSLALNLTPNDVNITYLFTESLKDAAARQAAFSIIQQEYGYLTYRYCHEQGIESGRIRFTTTSVADELTTVIQDAPQASHSFYQAALSVRLFFAYYTRTMLNTTDIFETPPDTPPPPLRITQLPISQMPFVVANLNPNYLEQFLIPKRPRSIL